MNQTQNELSSSFLVIINFVCNKKSNLKKPDVSDLESLDPDRPPVGSQKRSKGRPPVKRKAKCGRMFAPHIKDKKERKKLLNAEASRRYRDNRKSNFINVELEEQILADKNKRLESEVADLDVEVRTMKKLMVELGILKNPTKMPLHSRFTSLQNTTHINVKDEKPDTISGSKVSPPNGNCQSKKIIQKTDCTEESQDVVNLVTTPESFSWVDVSILDPDCPPVGSKKKIQRSSTCKEKGKMWPEVCTSHQRQKRFSV